MKAQTKIKAKTKNISIMLVDDHQIVRDGIKSLLSDQNGITIIEEAENGKIAIEKAKHTRANLIIMDINMPEINGIIATQKITRLYPKKKVLALSMYANDEAITNMIKAGAYGYILKDSGKDELVNAIRKVSSGKYYFGDNTSYSLFAKHIGFNQKSELRHLYISDREKEILKLISEGLTNIEIGERLNLSSRTADSHRRNLLFKYQANNSAHLVKIAIELGMLV